MNVICDKEQYNKPIVLALGFFDCVHVGHLALVNETKKMALSMKCETAICTFSNDPNALLNKSKQIYTFEERKSIFENIGIDNIIAERFTKEFAEQSPLEYLDNITNQYNIVGVVAGKDYTFGKNAEGNVAFLKEYLSVKGIKVKILPFEKVNSQKISTRHIKKFIEEGNVQVANTLLAQPYFMIGEVVPGRSRGSIIGFPTANVAESEDRTQIASGIYITKVYIDGKSYLSITNVGAKPTFNELNRTIETYILDFNKDIYGKIIKVEFFKKIRDIVKFTSVPALCNQMKQDEKETRAYFSI